MALTGLAPGWGPLVISCTAPLGVAMDEPGLDLAGLLATRVMRVLQAQGEDSVDKETDLPLPVAICPGGEAGWHWAASCVMVDPDMADLVGHRRRTRVMDSSWIGRAAARPWPVMLASKTAYKDRMTPHEVRGWGLLRWRAVGDPGLMMRLLAPVVALGKARGSGEGMVHSWRVETVDLPRRDWQGWIHVDSSGALLRPVPVECATRWGASERWEEGIWGLRPPQTAHVTGLAVPVPSDPTGDDPWML